MTSPIAGSGGTIVSRATDERERVRGQKIAKCGEGEPMA
jgi:hypothetical protein